MSLSPGLGRGPETPQEHFWTVLVLLLAVAILIIQIIVLSCLYVMVNHIFRPYMSQLVCIPRCLTVLQAVAMHWWVDLCSGYSRCCSSRVLILVLRLLVLVLVLALKWSRLHHWLCTTTRSSRSNNNSSSNLFTGRTSGQGTAIGRVRPVRLFPL